MIKWTILAPYLSHLGSQLNYPEFQFKTGNKNTSQSNQKNKHIEIFFKEKFSESSLSSESKTTYFHCKHNSNHFGPVSQCKRILRSEKYCRGRNRYSCEILNKKKEKFIKSTVGFKIAHNELVRSFTNNYKLGKIYLFCL